MVIAIVKWRIVRLTILLFLLCGPGFSGTQQSDPLLGYILSGDGASWSIGGDLTNIRPRLFLPPSTEENIRVSLSGIYADYYRPGALGSPQASFRRGASGEARVAGKRPFAWRLRAKSDDRLWQINVPNEGKNQNLIATYDNWITSLEGSAFVAPTVLCAGMGVGPGTPPEPHLACGLVFKRYGGLGAIWRRQRFRPDFDMYWRDENARVSLLGFREGITAWLNSPTVGPFRAELIIRRYSWIRFPQDSREPTMEPWGDQVGYHGYSTLDLGRWAVAIGGRGQKLDLMAYGVKYPYPYSKITAFRFDIDAIFASAKLRFPRRDRRLLIELEHLKWDGYARGHVEFWPFTSGLIDLLGLRRYFIAATSGHLWRMHIAGHGRLTDRWQAAGGINLFDIHPSAEIRHWRPAYLMFGKADEQFHSLDVYRLDAGIIHLSGAYRHTSWQIKYSITQAFKIRSWRPSGGAGPPSEASGKAGGYGGGFHRMSIGWFF